MGRVLLLDSDTAFLREAQRGLERRAHTCRTASSLVSALRTVDADRPDLIVVALDRRDGRGLDSVEQLLPYAPVVVLLSEGDDHLSLDVLSRGAFDVMVKAETSGERLAGRVDAILDGLRETASAGKDPNQLAETNAILRAQLDVTSEGTLVVDARGIVVSVNRRFLDLWNQESANVESAAARPLLARLVADPIATDPPGHLPADLVDDQGAVHQDVNTTLPGGRVISWSSQPVRMDDGRVIGRAFGFRDLTAQKTAEARARLQTTVLEHVPSAVVVTAFDGTVQYVNRFAEQLLGRTAGELLGRDVRPLLFTDEQLRQGVAALDAIRRGEAWRGEVDIQRLGKPAFPALLSVTRIEGATEADSLVLGVIMDLSDRRSLEAKLLQAQKMEAVGTLAGGLAHDFNNLLTGVLGSAALLREMLDPDTQLGDLMDMIERAALRGRDLCSQLLSFARADKPTVEPIATLETVEEVVKLSERTFPREVRLSVEAADDVPRMSGSRSQITQALMNLLVNARDAMPNGGRLIVRALSGNGVPADDLHHAEQQGTAFVRLDVEDHGGGMVPEVARRAFEPFFTTKSAAKGTGLGLPMVFSIAKGHGGAVRLWSVAGQGTTVSLFIPAAPADTAIELVESVDDRTLESFAGTETVLIVDDEAMVRTVGARILKQFGYRALEASSGPEALRIVEVEPVDAVLLDIVMPEMEGPEVFRRMREAGVDVPVLLCSGFSVAGLVDKLTKQGAAGFVQKPYRLQELLPILRDALDRRSTVGEQLTAQG